MISDCCCWCCCWCNNKGFDEVEIEGEVAGEAGIEDVDGDKE